MHVIHHGADQGVTGSCHQLIVAPNRSFLIDCGLFQGRDAKGRNQEEIEFSLDGIEALVVTHIHLDHVGRIPFLIAAGFRKPIYCTPPTAQLLPLVLEDSVRVGVTRNKQIIERFIDELRRMIRIVPYHQWHDLQNGLKLRLKPAGHVLGSAIVEFEKDQERVVFSGDLGTRDQPLMVQPASPERADLLVLESTYGNRLHENREHRIQSLEAVLTRTLENRGVTIIPAFSVGRTQELLFELNWIMENIGRPPRNSLLQAVDIIIDSPLALRFNELYDKLRGYWSDEAKQVLIYDDQPLVFENLVKVESHAEHLDTIQYLKRSQLPAIVIAASGMCAGGRVVSYLKEFITEPTTDILFVGFQAVGTPGRYIQDTAWVMLDGQRYEIAAKRHTLSGYSAHADQADLIRFVDGMQSRPGQIRLVHGEEDAKSALATELSKRGYKVD
jgi:metallo-beta-lactamase family protein